MRLSEFVAYLKENRWRFCEIQCWDLSRNHWGFPCEKCLDVFCLHMHLQKKNYERMHLLFHSLWFREELMEIYHNHFVKEKKDNSFVCNIL